jgi:hypothetical protein
VKVANPTEICFYYKMVTDASDTLVTAVDGFGLQAGQLEILQMLLGPLVGMEDLAAEWCLL